MPLPTLGLVIAALQFSIHRIAANYPCRLATKDIGLSSMAKFITLSNSNLNSKQQASRLEHILRDSLKGISPEAIRTRTRKLGFPNLSEAWTSPQAIAFMQDVVHSQPFQEKQRTYK